MTDRPWHKLHATTWLAVAVVTLTMVWANWHVRGPGMFAKRDFVWEQGWPTTSRVEEDRPIWPLPTATFGNPNNFVQWRPLEIIINTAAFLLILAATAFACERWRRRGIRPWQFNIGFVLATITVVAVLWWMHGHVDELMHRWTSDRGLLSFLPEYEDYDWIGTYPWIASAPLIFGECCLVYVLGVFAVNGAKWLTQATQPRAWYRPHLSSVIAAAVVAFALLWVNGQTRSGYIALTTRSYQGWPANFRIFWENFPPVGSGARQILATDDRGVDLHGLAMVANVGVFVLLVAGTLTASEIVRRRSFRWGQFTLRTFSALMTIVVVVWGLHANADRLYACLSGDQNVHYWRLHPVLKLDWSGFIHEINRPPTDDPVTGWYVSYPWQYPFPWYVMTPIFFGEGCTLYALGWLLLRMFPRLRSQSNESRGRLMTDRPWYKLHATTWLAIAVVGLTMAWANWHVQGIEILNVDSVWRQGWPTIARVEMPDDDRSRWPLASVRFGDPTNIVTHHPFEIFINTSAFLLILAATAFACERWRRRGIRPWQFNIGFVLATITVVAVLWWMHGHVDELMHRWTSDRGLLSFLPEYEDYDWIGTYPWLASAPLIFGECCLVYALGVFAVNGAKWFTQASQPRAWYRPHPSSVIVATVVAFALLWVNGQLRSGNFVMSERSYQGWPANFRTFRVDYQVAESSTRSEEMWTVYSGVDLSALAMIVDIGVFMLLVAGTLAAAERIRRSNLRVGQIEMLLGLVAIVVIVWGLHSNVDDLYALFSGDQNVYYWREHPVQEEMWHTPREMMKPPADVVVPKWYVSYPWQYPFPWYVFGPILFGEGCVLYASGCLLVRLIHRPRTPRTTAEAAS